MDIGTTKDVIYFARTDYRGSNKLFGIRRNDRRQHVYVVGKTGTGKTTLLNNMIVQDIANGEGVCVVDPHGELIEELLEKVPEHRLKDIVYFNPADTEYHIGFNVLELPDPKYKNLVASGLMGIFTKIWANTWSARMEYILNNAILALLDTPNSSLLGILRILTDKEYRQKVINNVQDPVVRAFWINEYEAWRDQFRNEAIAPIQNKVGQFLSTSLIRNIVGQAKSTINIFNLMNEGKVLLVNVSKGRIGEDNSALLGAMIITKIQLAAMERVRIPEDERVDFYLYVDEFQNFATDSFAGILSEARKYRLNLTLAHQYIGQLITDTSTKVRDAIFGNVGTMIVFRVGAADAEFLEKEFEPEFLIQDIVNLPNRAIYLKLMCDGITSRPFSAGTIPPLKAKVQSVAKEKIIEASRKIYGRPVQVVEEEIKRWSSTGGGESSGGALPGFASRESGTGSRSFTPGQRPVGDRPFPQRQPSRVDYSALAQVGIEFEPQKTATPSVPAEQRSFSPTRSSQSGSRSVGEVPPRRPSSNAAQSGQGTGAGPGTTSGQTRPFQDNNRAGYMGSQPGESKKARPEFSHPAKPGDGPDNRPQKVFSEAKDESPAKPEETPGISLKDLKPKEASPKHNHVQEVNVDDFRKAISDALGSYLDADKGEDEKK